MAKVRIGFATTDGVMIDQHFGTARYWQIYDFGEEAEYVEDRMTRPSCKGHCEGGFDETLDQLSDCDALFCAKIGEGAAYVCISRGIRVFEAAGDLERIALAIIEQGLLEDIKNEKKGEA